MAEAESKETTDESSGIIRTKYGDKEEIDSAASDEKMEVDSDSAADNGNGSTSLVSQQEITLRPKGFIQYMNPRLPRIPPVTGAVYNATFKTSFKPRGIPWPPRSGGPTPPPPPKKSKIFFRHCGGLEKQVNFLKAAVLRPIQDHNTSHDQFKRFGLQPPKGVLFYGPPGTGKTRLAQALGHELTKALGSNVHFIYRKGQDIASMFFGQSSVNLRSVFEEAREMQPCVLFFDELDGLCPSRDTPMISQSNVTIVTTMLGLMDELPVGKVFVIGATNRLEAVDPALRRPGRFDKYLEFLPPTVQGRFDILGIHTRNWKHKPSGEMLEQMSQRTTGFSGADLFKLCLDAFDSALSRQLAGGKNFRSVDLTNLFVLGVDWETALGKMRPSNSAVFGSTFYTPPLSLGDQIEPLIREDVEEITERLLKFFPANNEAPRFGQDAAIRSLYVWTETGSSLASIDDFIIAPVLTSEQLGKYPIYCVSPEILCSTHYYEWSRKIDDTVSQAIAAGYCILYVQNADVLWQTIKDGRVGLAMDLEQQLERLRGTSVLLLATGSINPRKLSPDNSFQTVLARSEDAQYQVDYPSDDQRLEFFEPLFSSVLMQGNVKWSKENTMKLAKQTETAAEYTLSQHLGSIMLLYGELVQARDSMTNANDSDEILETLEEIMGSYINIHKK